MWGLTTRTMILSEGPRVMRELDLKYFSRMDQTDPFSMGIMVQNLVGIFTMVIQLWEGKRLDRDGEMGQFSKGKTGQNSAGINISDVNSY